MKATTIKLAMREEKDHQVKAYEITPGLFAHRHHTRNREWSISHHSGRALGGCFGSTLRELVKVSRAVQSIVPVDWTLDVQTIGAKHHKQGMQWMEAFKHVKSGGTLDSFDENPFMGVRLSWRGQPVETPSESQVRSWIIGDQNCEALDGCTVEPDGYCEHGAPSFLIAMGLI